MYLDFSRFNTKNVVWFAMRDCEYIADNKYVSIYVIW